MADIAGSISTTAEIAVGGTLTNTLEVVGDHDWVKLALTAGQQVTVSLTGLTLEDPYLRIRDALGNVIFENDDINSGVIRDSKLSFTAPSTGIFFVDVGAWDERYTGTYELTVQPYVPPPVWTTSQVSDFLVSGYWGGESSHFNVSAGGSITVNMMSLTAAGRNLAEQALGRWSEIIGINFVQVTSGGQITFDDNESGAFADSSASGGYITSSHVNVSTQWLSNYGTGINSYSFQTYIHEIGHALGLGHAGYYNGSADYMSDALFANDGWPTTVMSYFDQTESSYFSSLGFDRNFVTTPMMADILAIGSLYGLSTTTRVGDTTYGAASGWHANMGAITVFDTGGVDTIDVSGLAGAHSINLSPETFSNVMGQVGNVSIAPGVIIENATGGTGNDVLRGNHVSNVLIGGAGDDMLYGAGGNDVMNGGTGADQMFGDAGDDRYFVDDARDVIREGFGGGFDTVVTTVQYIASDDVERIEVADATTTYEINLYGNAHANQLVGNQGNNLLNGYGGTDFMAGLGGNDIYFVESGADVILEGSGGGFDTVFSTVNYALSDDIERVGVDGFETTFAINLTGNLRDNELWGNDGENIIGGSGGSDILHGNGGADSFVFASTIYHGAIDQLVDFEAGIDEIWLDDGEFAGLAPGALSANAFVTGSAARDADDRIIFDPQSGSLWFDIDGTGAATAVQFAVLPSGTALTSGDFLVI